MNETYVALSTPHCSLMAGERRSSDGFGTRERLACFEAAASAALSAIKALCTASYRAMVIGGSSAEGEMAGKSASRGERRGEPVALAAMLDDSSALGDAAAGTPRWEHAVLGARLAEMPEVRGVVAAGVAYARAAIRGEPPMLLPPPYEEAYECCERGSTFSAAPADRAGSAAGEGVSSVASAGEAKRGRGVSRALLPKAELVPPREPMMRGEGRGVRCAGGSRLR